MLKFIFLFTLFLIVFYLYSNKIHIDLKTFFKRGFKSIGNVWGVYCYSGKQGTGKTYSCIKFLLEQKQKHNYKIITNVKSFKDKTQFADTLYIADFIDIINYCKQFKDNKDNVIIFYDEIFTLLEKNTRVNKEILSFLSQLRKRGIILLTTAQEWAEINITFRRYVRYQIECHMFSLPFSKTAILFNSINDGDTIHWDDQQQDFISNRISANLSKGLKSVIDSYDTYETIKTSNKS